MTTKSIKNALRQFFFMKERIAEAEQRSAAAGDLGVNHARAARLLLAAAESFEGEADRQFGAVLMLREAAVLAAQGVAERRHLAISTENAGEIWKAVSELTDLEPVLKKQSAAACERLASVVGGGTALDYYGSSAAELSALSQTLLDVVRLLVNQLEGDVLAPRRLRFERLARWTGAVLLVATVAAYGMAKVKHLFRPNPTNTGSTNVALNKSVKMSSNWRTDLYPPERLVDGDTTQLGCHSERQDNPSVVVDLEGDYYVHRVVVTNRKDGLAEFAVPLIIEVSLDGSSYTEYARQNENFAVWTAKGKRTEARYVKLTVPKSTILHLNEIEVY